MQIVIDLPKEQYDLVKKESKNSTTELCLMNAVADGTPLPEHHGKIGDIDKLQAVFNKNVVGADAFDDLFDAAEAIVPATERSN